MRDLDLSKNEFRHGKDFARLAQLHLVSLDLCECPVTRLPDYRAKAFAMIKSLQYLDKLDAENNERPVSEGNGDGGRPNVCDEVAEKVGTISASFGAGDVDEENDDDGNESDKLDEDEVALPYRDVQKADKKIRHGNEESDSDEEQIEDNDGTRNADLQDLEESEDEAIEDDDGGEVKGDTEQASRPLVNTEGSFDGQEDGNEENGEIGDEEEDGDEGVDDGEEDEENGDEGVDDDEEEEDYGTDYLVQPIAPAEEEEGASDFEPCEDDEDDDDDEDIEDDEEDDEPAASLKRKRSKGQDVDSDNDGRPVKH